MANGFHWLQPHFGSWARVLAPREAGKLWVIQISAGTDHAEFVHGLGIGYPGNPRRNRASAVFKPSSKPD